MYTIKLDFILICFFTKTENVMFIAVHNFKGYVFVEEILLTIVVNKRVNQFVYINQINHFILGTAYERRS